MRSFDELVSEAAEADVTGWGFGWLDRRASEERPPWHYVQRLAERLATVDAALDIDTGGGEVLAEVSRFPPTMVATEAWPPNLVRARDTLGARGVTVLACDPADPLPVPAESFDLVTARHPVSPQWREIHRVLRPGGSYFAQHVGPASAFELIELFVGPLVEERFARDPHREVADAARVGLALVDLQTARCRMQFDDVGAVVWILRKCPWWVPDFSVEKYRDTLVRLDQQMRGGEPFVAHSTRHLIELRK